MTRLSWLLAIALACSSAQAQQPAPKPSGAKARKSKKPTPQPAAPAPAESPAPAAAIPIEPLVPPPPPSAPAEVKRIEAYADVPAPAPTEATAEAPSQKPASGRPRLFVGPRVGAVVPFYFLKPGYEAGGEVEFRLPFAGGRLRAALFAGVLQATGKGERLVPRRGLDPAFIENLLAFPVELGARYEAWSSGSHALHLSAAYAAYLSRGEFRTLGATTASGGMGHAAVAGAGYRMRLGPGEAGLAARATLGRVPLGPLGDVGTESLSSVAFTVSYAFGFAPEE
ncbi:MAG: hypothetical protein HYZ28_23850 [Myxococcales bacterium]|nr:hypothetical protein [Myxococcales bacterium]